MKKLTIKCICIIILISTMMCMLNIASAVTINSINFYDQQIGAAFDVRGTVNDGTTGNLRTSYDNDGYETYFKVGTNEQEISDYTSGTTITNDGV